MTSDLLVKRLLKQASVSVLAGLLMSSAVLAEDITEPVVEPEGEVSITVEDETAGPDVTLDPIEFEGEVVYDEVCIDCSGVVEDASNLTDPPEPIDGEVLVDPKPEDMIDPVEFDGEVIVDGGCAECSGEPEVVITADGTDPVEFDGNPEIVQNLGGNGGFEPEHRGNAAPAAPTFARSSGGSDDDTICKPVWTKGIAKIEC